MLVSLGTYIAAMTTGDRHADLMAVVRDASPEEQLALIRAHPELADHIDVDRYGNVTALKRGRHDRPRLMLSAPTTGALLSPMLAAAAMSLSSVSVIGNALRLRAVRL